MIKHGSYRAYQRYRCKDCDRTFNDKTGTIFAHAKIGLEKLLFAFYTLLRFNTSIRQLDAELDVSYRSLRRRVEQFARTLDAPAINFVGPVEIDEVYVTAGLKGRERDSWSRSRGLSKRGSGCERHETFTGHFCTQIIENYLSILLMSPALHLMG